MLVAALLVIPAIAIESSDVGEPWDTDRDRHQLGDVARLPRGSAADAERG